ncbi:ParA family protein [Spiroplasma endosymbiont of Eupeodes luniger]|uniref:ParA family protein n=1 Tax=Spiroplasma endosymbiont of Eupeodes luniger TaxID=3066300 RepID=UPI0030D40861
MKIITIGALKGGVGKTNFTFNLAGYLSIKENKKILLIDLDPQGNLTQCLQLDIFEPLAMNMFINQEKNIKELILKTEINNLDIIPTNIGMSSLEVKLFNEISRETKFMKYINKNKDYLSNKYDYILIDTNPSLNITNINAYAVADSIILVSDNSVHSLRALEIVGNMWEQISLDLEIDNNIKAVILNNFDTFSISKDFINEIKESNLKTIIILQEIRKKQVFKASEITGIPVIKTLKKEENPYFNIVDQLKQKGVL